jgi:antitoxin (DNA-binding transcriptional repressor) of toxin-antitoxin stability system
MPDYTFKTQTKKLRKNLRKLLEQTLDRIEVGTEQALAYARKLVARVSPQRRRAA